MHFMFIFKIVIWIIAYTVGITRLSLAIILLIREKRRLDFWKVAFLLVFNLVIISLTNQEVVLVLNSGPVNIFGNIADYAAALIIMTLPVYIHAELGNLKNRRIKDQFFISLSLILCLLLTIGFILKIQKLNDVIFITVIVLMSATIIYSNLLPLIMVKPKKHINKAMLFLSISVIILIPLMLWIDFFNNQFAGYIILPIMYLDINILMILSEIGDLIHTSGGETISMEKMIASGLTGREQEVAALLLDGLTYQQTADRLCISIQTVKTHANRIYSKTNSKNKMDLYQHLKA